MRQGVVCASVVCASICSGCIWEKELAGSKYEVLVNCWRPARNRLGWFAYHNPKL
jgi:hypothetical protein